MLSDSAIPLLSLSIYIYLTRTHTEREREREREKGSSLYTLPIAKGGPGEKKRGMDQALVMPVLTSLIKYVQLCQHRQGIEDAMWKSANAVLA